MVTKVFIDTNIVIDILEKRMPYCTYATNLLQLASEGHVSLFATTLTFANALYVARPKIGKSQAMAVLSKMRKFINVAPSTQTEFDKSFDSDCPDFEDALQYYSAEAVDADFIITRNEKHFRFSSIPVMTAEEFLK